MRRRRLPPTVASPGQRTTCRREPQESRAPPVLLQWPAVTHSPTPVTPGWWGQDPSPCYAPIQIATRLAKTPLSQRQISSCERVRRFLPAIFSVRHPRKRTQLPPPCRGLT